MAITSHNIVPWSVVRRWYANFRKTYFTKEIPVNRPFLKVDMELTELRGMLGRRSYAPNSEFSYHYEGEDLNLAHVIWFEDPDHPEVDWWQVHVRAWDLPSIDGIVVHAHWEPEPTEHGDEHLDGVGFSSREGMRAVKDILDTRGIPYVDFEWTKERLNEL